MQSSKELFAKVMANLVERGAQGIILGCTEIGLLVGAEDCSLPLFDTTEIHAVAAVEQADGTRPEVDEAVQILRAWDGRAEVDSAGMTLFRAWWLALQPERAQIPEDAIQRGARLSQDVQVILLTSLDQAVQRLCDQFGRIHVPWGELGVSGR